MFMTTVKNLLNSMFVRWYDNKNSLRFGSHLLLPARAHLSLFSLPFMRQYPDQIHFMFTELINSQVSTLRDDRAGDVA